MTTIHHHTITLASGSRLDVAERGRGPAILFLHGYTDSWRSYTPVLESLPEDVRALAVSQRGHGDSDRPPSGYRIADLAADAASLLDAAGIEEATVVGHSMGSLVAQELAISRPERVSRLVLIGSATTLDNPIIRELDEAVRQLGDTIPYEFVWEFQFSTLHRPVPDDFLRMAVSESIKVPARIWRDALAGQIEFHSDGRLGALTMPALIVWGDRDQIASRAEQERLLRGIRGSRFVEYVETGHALHWEQPGRFAGDLLSFLRETETMSRRGTKLALGAPADR